MKRLSITNLSIFFMGILRRNNLSTITLSLLCISTAFLLIVQHEKEAMALQKQWLPSDLPEHGWRLLGRKPVIKNLPVDLTLYNIKASFMISENTKSGNIEIQFCDKYSLILEDSRMPSGVYFYKTDNSAKEYVSKISYKNVIIGKVITSPRLKNINLFLGCDLIEKTVSIYINDKFMEKLYLGPETMHDAVRLSINSPDIILLDKLQISDHKGKVLFNADYAWLSFYKLASQILIFLGVLILLVLACSENRFFKRFLYFMLILLCIEGFLRIGERDNQNFNIRKLVHKWDFAASTNFYGTYNNPKEIVIRNCQNLTLETYPITKPENSMRIICIGSSPLQIVGSSNNINKAFPAILENKINPKLQMKNRVINISLVQTYINSLEPNVYLKEVLFKLNPDLVIFYFDWKSPSRENNKEHIDEDYTLYNRAKKIMEQDSSWIKDDQLLYASFEFKRPIKKIVYLYNFLCKSYLFMGLENARKRIFNRLYYINQEPSSDKSKSYLDETIKLGREKKIKILLIPKFDFALFQSSPIVKEEFQKILNKNPEVYYLDLEDMFRRNKNFQLAVDDSHFTEYGHRLVAEEIFKKLTQIGLIDTNSDLINKRMRKKLKE